MKKTSFSKILILGSGGLRIGQAGEFDYSGSQAIKALKEEKIATVLINPNIATVQTDHGMADQVYLQPLNLQTAIAVIKKEKPDGIFLSFGGQTALNLGLALDEQGILAKYNVQVLGTSIEQIRYTEDRELFKNKLREIDIKTAESFSAETVEEALIAAEKLGYPIMLRAGYSLGGQGSGCIHNAHELRVRAKEVLNGAPQILIEEYLGSWKEIEYEIVRDRSDNAITVCNMENMDPMGIHTGESIVVAPSQTLTNEEYHNLRAIALRTARHMQIVGECNIQYALNPTNGDYRVIEMNARLSRSSALASKATGYPLAFVAAKLALGYRLFEIQNSVTKKTSAFFEPALDYLVVKIPRWDINKLASADHTIGSEMKSVGEVMAIGRSFPEALQKAVRMLHGSSKGLVEYSYPFPSVTEEIHHATDRRIFALYAFFRDGGTVAEAQKLSSIDPWFLHHIASIVSVEECIKTEKLSPELFLTAKQYGFSDHSLAFLTHGKESSIRQQRKEHGIFPAFKQIDTLAGEFDAETNYLYTTYHGTEHDISPSKTQAVMILGSGPYCIGSSVEFDWCAVNTARTLKAKGVESILINSNPETVSTDYDESDRLYFEELTFERVQDIADFENPKGIVVSVGGQVANNLALPLDKAKYPLLGTRAKDIDRAEDRQKFSSLLNELGIDQPQWEAVTTLEKARLFAHKVGYPILARPSYVLSGAAMKVISDTDELETYIQEAIFLSPDFPIVISEFISHAKELEVDGVAKNGKIVIEAISEHIENAGVHSGDATIVLPPQRLYLEAIRQTKKITRSIVKALNITGPFNMQFIAKENALKVIECNVRASRSFPFVSKVTNHPFIEIATHVLLNCHQQGHYETLELDYVGIKTPQFSYNRLKGSSPIAHVEMASTGEVACLGDNYLEAFYTSWLATEQSIKEKKILVSIGGEQKEKFLKPLSILEEQGWDIYSTEGTHLFLSKHGVASVFVYKTRLPMDPNVKTIIENQEVSLIINIPRRQNLHTETDGHILRRLAIDHHIPLITNLQIALLFLQCLAQLEPEKIPIRSLQEYTHSNHF